MPWSSSASRKPGLMRMSQHIVIVLIVFAVIHHAASWSLVKLLIGASLSTPGSASVRGQDVYFKARDFVRVGEADLVAA